MILASELKVRPAAIAEAEMILSFIAKKSEFDRNIGAFSGKIETSVEKIRQTMFSTMPFAQVLFAEIDAFVSATSSKLLTSCLSKFSE